jgi:hypothetical protein
MSSRLRTTHTSNRLLEALSPWAYSGLKHRLETRALASGQTLYAVQDTTTEVAFPTSAVVSLTLDAGGRSTGVTLVSGEGGLGVWLALGLGRSPWGAVVRADGEALVLPSELFRALLRDEPDFRDHMVAYGRELFELSSQAIACSQLHDRRARLARWLLEGDDRCDGTPDQSAGLLRAMTGEAAEDVQRFLDASAEAGTIELLAARIRILDRGSLEAIACGCYAAS